MSQAQTGETPQASASTVPMNTTEIAHKLAKMYPDLTNKMAEAYVRSTFDLMADSLAKMAKDTRDRVSIRGFGNFGVKATAARTVKNIKTREPQQVPAGNRITFKAAAELKEALAAGKAKVEPYATQTVSKPSEAAAEGATGKAEKATPAGAAPAAVPQDDL